MKERLCNIRTWVILCICFLIFLSVPCQIESNESPLLHMNVKINFGQLVKYNRYANIRVELENQNVEEFHGYFQAILETDEGPEDCMYQNEFSIRRNTKRNLNIALPVKEGISKIQFRIANKKGNVIIQKEEKLKLEPEGENLYLGVVGEGREFVKNLEGIVPKTIEIPENEIPEVEEGLDIFDTIVISNDYLNESSLERLSTIRRWCKAGGTVMIGKLDIAEKNFFGVSYKPSEVIKNQLGEKIYQIYEMEDGILLEWVHSGDFLEDIKNHPEYVENSFYDMNTYYSKFIRQRHYREKCLCNNAENQLVRSLEGGEKRYLPKAMAYGVVIVLYAFIVGPLLYLFLAKRQKPLFYYIGVPIIAAVFSIIVLGIGSNTRISQPNLNSITILRYDENASKVEERSFISINMPAADKERITVDKESNIEMMNVSVNTEDDKDCKVVIEQGAYNSKIELKEPLYMKSYIFKNTAKQERTGKIDYDLNFNGKCIEGTITNHLGFELQDAVLISNYHFVKLGNLKDGMKKRVSNKQDVVNQYSFTMDTKELVEQLTGIDSDEKSDDLAAMRKNAAEAYILRQECFDYSNQSYIIGYVKENAGAVREGVSRKNISLIHYNLQNVKKVYQGQQLITDIENFRKLTNGNINTETRIMNSDSAIVTYHFPSGMKIDSILYLANLNYENCFHGVISIFNNVTKKYDILFQGDDSYVKMDGDKYITNDNRIVIKYSSYTQQRGTIVEELPVLSALLSATEEVN